MKTEFDVYVIVVTGSQIAKDAEKTLKKTSKDVGNPFEIKRFDAVVPSNLSDMLLKHDLHWNYPWDVTDYCVEYDVMKQPYKTRNRDAKISCAVSHYLMWKKCHEENTPILILEHDAMFIKRLSEEMVDEILKSRYYYVGLNDPRGATRKANVFHNEIQNRKSNTEKRLLECPWIEPNNRSSIQGLAGASAYFIKPKGAAILLELVEEMGLWHNDCMISHQLIPSRLGVSSQYFTKVQPNVRSTTVF
jgi:GR25 family glycosyltransferase involved in LPS biosynthesis